MVGAAHVSLRCNYAEDALSFTVLLACKTFMQQGEYGTLASFTVAPCVGRGMPARGGLLSLRTQGAQSVTVQVQHSAQQ